MKIFFKPKAKRDLEKLDSQTKIRILKKLQFYSTHSNPFRFAESLKDLRFGSWRFRVGSYRILCDADDGRIIVLKIGHRKDIYK
jgi:mRNA interferase RelE/StbE